MTEIEQIRRIDFTPDCERAFHKLDALTLHLTEAMESIQHFMEEIRVEWKIIKESQILHYDQYLICRIAREGFRTGRRVKSGYSTLNEIVYQPTLISCLETLQEIEQFLVEEKEVIDKSHETLMRCMGNLDLDTHFIVSDMSRNLLFHALTTIRAVVADLKHTVQYKNETKQSVSEPRIVNNGNMVYTNGSNNSVNAWISGISVRKDNESDLISTLKEIEITPEATLQLIKVLNRERTNIKDVGLCPEVNSNLHILLGGIAAKPGPMSYVQKSTYLSSAIFQYLGLSLN